MKHLNSVKQLMIMLIALVVAQGAWATYNFSTDGKTLTIENYVEDDWKGLKDLDNSKFTAVETVVMKGSLSNNGGAINQLANKISPSVLDMTNLNADALTNNKDALKDVCKGEGTTAYLPTAMTTIPEWTFGSGWEVENIIVPNTVTTISNNAFRNCKMKTITIGNGIQTIGSGAFFQCPNLTDAIFESGLSGVRIGYDEGDGVFQECASLKHVTIPEGVEYIGANIFKQSTLLASVHLPSTLRTIGNEAFVGCSDLTIVVIPKNVTSIGKQCFLNSGVRDIYVMAETVETIPTIYPCTDGGNGTFVGSQHLGLNDESKVANIIIAESKNYDYDTKFASKKSEYISAGKTEAEAEELANEFCRADLRDIILETLRKTTDLHTMTLHYPAVQALTDFYDNNPYKGVETRDGGRYTDNVTTNEGGNWDDPNSLKINKDHLSDTYSLKDCTGNLWPIKGDNPYTNQDGVDYSNQPTYYDYYRRIQAGREGGTLSGTLDSNTPSRYGWCQLPIMTGFTDTEVITKYVDDTWYTFCFPCDVTDEQLAVAFNEGFNIAEFNAARILKVDDEDALVFFFRKVAKTEPITENTYGPKYRDDVLAKGCHPYMIHPNKGVSPFYDDDTPRQPGDRVEAYITLTLTVPPTGYVYDTNVNKKTVPLMDARNATRNTGKVWKDYKGREWKEVVYDGETQIGDFTFTFIGNVTPLETEAKAIGAGNYFLGCEMDDGNGTSVWPRFYKETEDGYTVSGGTYQRLWTPYTAIIQPSAGADAWLSANLNTSSEAKKVSIDFQEDAIATLEPTAINNILIDAEQKNLPVKYMPVVYNIDGEVVRTDSIELNGLPRGLYIVNGKKYFVK